MRSSLVAETQLIQGISNSIWYAALSVGTCGELEELEAEAAELLEQAELWDAALADVAAHECPYLQTAAAQSAVYRPFLWEMELQLGWRGGQRGCG